jgi:uroporphyrin-III C-methyltransferase/precorrin-2 dehydrogenase/sirohydrochlorin ferrochelatase
VASNDPDDLSIRTARLLAQADLVLHQAAVAPAVLNRARADAQRAQCETAPDVPPPGMTVFVEWQG